MVVVALLSGVFTHKVAFFHANLKKKSGGRKRKEERNERERERKMEGDGGKIGSYQGRQLPRSATPPPEPRRKGSLSIWQDIPASSSASAESIPLRQQQPQQKDKKDVGVVEVGGVVVEEDDSSGDEAIAGEGNQLHRSGSTKLDHLLIREGVVGPIVQGNNQVNLTIIFFENYLIMISVYIAMFAKTHRPSHGRLYVYPSHLVFSSYTHHTNVRCCPFLFDPVLYLLA